MLGVPGQRFSSQRVTTTRYISGKCSHSHPGHKPPWSKHYLVQALLHISTQCDAAECLWEPLVNVTLSLRGRHRISSVIRSSGVTREACAVFYTQSAQDRHHLPALCSRAELWTKCIAHSRTTVPSFSFHQEMGLWTSTPAFPPLTSRSIHKTGRRWGLSSSSLSLPWI